VHGELTARVAPSENPPQRRNDGRSRVATPAGTDACFRCAGKFTPAGQQLSHNVLVAHRERTRPEQAGTHRRRARFGLVAIPGKQAPPHPPRMQRL
jgi:hypothetical protein